MPFFFFLPLLLAGSDQESATGAVRTGNVAAALLGADVDFAGAFTVAFLGVSNGDFVDDDGARTGKSAAVGRWLVLTGAAALTGALGASFFTHIELDVPDAAWLDPSEGNSSTLRLGCTLIF